MHCACLFDVFFSWCQPLCRDVIDKLLDYLDRLPSHISCMTSLGSSIQSLFENRDYVGCGPLFLDCIVKSQVVSWLPCHVMCRLKSKTSWSMHQFQISRGFMWLIYTHDFPLINPLWQICFVILFNMLDNFVHPLIKTLPVSNFNLIISIVLFTAYLHWKRMLTHSWGRYSQPIGTISFLPSLAMWLALHGRWW